MSTVNGSLLGILQKQLVYTSGGSPKKHMSAVRADGSGTTVWENSVRVYVPSMIAHEGFLYTVADAGVAMCWKCDNGKQIWKSRLGGTFTASPVLVGKHLFATNESGQTFIYKANPKKFERVAVNKLGDGIYVA